MSTALKGITIAAGIAANLVLATTASADLSNNCFNDFDSDTPFVCFADIKSKIQGGEASNMTVAQGNTPNTQHVTLQFSERKFRRNPNAAFLLRFADAANGREELNMTSACIKLDGTTNSTISEPVDGALQFAFRDVPVSIANDISKASCIHYTGEPTAKTAVAAASIITAPAPAEPTKTITAASAGSRFDSRNCSNNFDDATPSICFSDIRGSVQGGKATAMRVLPSLDDLTKKNVQIDLPANWTRKRDLPFLFYFASSSHRDPLTFDSACVEFDNSTEVRASSPVQTTHDQKGSWTLTFHNVSAQIAEDVEQAHCIYLFRKTQVVIRTAPN